MKKLDTSTVSVSFFIAGCHHLPYASVDYDTICCSTKHGNKLKKYESWIEMDIFDNIAKCMSNICKGHMYHEMVHLQLVDLFLRLGDI